LIREKLSKLPDPTKIDNPVLRRVIERRLENDPATKERRKKEFAKSYLRTRAAIEAGTDTAGGGGGTDAEQPSVQPESQIDGRRNSGRVDADKPPRKRKKGGVISGNEGAQSSLAGLHGDGQRGDSIKRRGSKSRA